MLCLWNPTSGAQHAELIVYTILLKVRKPDCENLFSQRPNLIPVGVLSAGHAHTTLWLRHETPIIAVWQFSCRDECAYTRNNG